MFVDWIFSCIAWFYNLVGDWGMAIIIITIIFRLIIFPITFKQYKSSFLMNKLQPKIKAVQEMYADDRQKQGEEMQRIYREAHYNPLTGCLPLILQMPIFIALFQALQSLSDRVEPGSVLSFYGILPDLTANVGAVFTEQGVLAAIPYIVCVILFSLSVFVPTLLMGNKERMTLITMGFMAVFMIFVAVQSPGGVLLYWDVSALIGLGIQFVMRSYYKKKDAIEEAEEAKKIAEVKVTRKQKKARPTKRK